MYFVIEYFERRAMTFQIIIKNTINVNFFIVRLNNLWNALYNVHVGLHIKIILICSGTSISAY